MFLVVSLLNGSTTLGLVDRHLHRIGHFVGVQDHSRIGVSSGPADRLDQGRLAAQKTFLVGIENRHQRNFRQSRVPREASSLRRDNRMHRIEVLQQFHTFECVQLAVQPSATDVLFLKEGD